MAQERARDRVRRALKTEALFITALECLLPTAVACILIWIALK